MDGGHQVGIGQPEIALRVDGEHGRIDLGPDVGKQLEGAGDHAVVAEGRFFLDLVAQRHDVVAVVPGDLVARAVGLIGRAGFRADVDRLFRQQVCRAHMGKLGLAHARAAAVEDRDHEFELELACCLDLGAVVLLLPFRFRSGDELEVGHITGRFGELVGLGHRFEVQAGDLQVDAAFQRFRLDAVLARQRLRQVRQAVRHLVIDIAAPETHQPCQVFLGKTGCQTSFGRLAGKFRVEDVFARLVALAHGPGLTEFCGKLGGGIRSRLGLVQLRDGFPCGNRLDPGATGFGGQLQRAEGGVELCLAETGIGDRYGLVAGQQRQDVGGDETFDRLVGSQFRRSDAGGADRDGGVEEQRRLPRIGRGVAEVGIGRLQALVVEQGDLNGRIGVDGLALQQRLDLGIDLVGLFAVLDPDALLGRGRRDLGIHGGEAGVLGRVFGHAAGEHERQTDGCCEVEFAKPHDASPLAVDCASLSGPQALGPVGSRWM